MKLLIRPAIEADAPSIARIHILSWQATYRGQIPDRVLDNLSLSQRTKDWYERLSSGVAIFVAEKNNEVVGFVSVCPTRDKDDDPKTTLEISAVYLLPDYARQGIGKELSHTVQRYAANNGFTSITAWVLESNAAACQFYEKMGFMTTGDVELDHIGCEQLQTLRYRKMVAV